MPSSCLPEEAYSETLLLGGFSESVYEASVYDNDPQVYRQRGGAALHRLDGWEIRLVRKMFVSTDRRNLHQLAKSLTWLGNGWIYPVVAILVACLETRVAPRLILAGAISASLCFAMYPLLKKRVGRLRPFHVDPSIDATYQPLDHHSFPSGHCMAATAVAVPLAMALPHALIAILISWMLIAWSRISSGHHFPTDVLFGAAMGGLISYPIALLIL